MQVLLHNQQLQEVLLVASIWNALEQLTWCAASKFCCTAGGRVLLQSGVCAQCGVLPSGGIIASQPQAEAADCWLQILWLLISCKKLLLLLLELHNVLRHSAYATQALSNIVHMGDLQNFTEDMATADTHPA